MNVRIFTNEVAGGWLATDLDKFLGGSEEYVVLLAEALIKQGFQVSVYHTIPAGENTPYEKRGVKYSSRESVQVNKNDILISFKDNLPWLGGEQDAAVKIHVSAEIEKPWNCSELDYFLHLSRFHKRQNLFVPDHINRVVPPGVSVSSILGKGSGNKTPNQMLYCSSPDRGLIPLLEDWEKIKKHHPKLQLRITYGFKNLMLMGDPRVRTKIESLCKQEDVFLLGELSMEEMNTEYQKADYWVLPLQIPSAELFCLNAVKAQLCGCMPVVNQVGALKDTVGEHIPYAAFVNGDTSTLPGNESLRIYSWDQVVKNYWVPMFEKSI